MISLELFSHLPNNELGRRESGYRNHAGASFEPMPSWALNDETSGRGMSLADLDNDGDLDIVVNNLGSPAKLFENRLCGGDSILVDLRQRGVGNGQGIGSRLTLYTIAASTTAT